MELDDLNQRAARSCRRRTRRSRRSSRAPARRCASSRRAHRLGLVPAQAADTSYLDLGALSDAGRQLADPPPAPLHPARLRSAPRARQLDRDAYAPRRSRRWRRPRRKRRSSSRPGAARSSTAWARRSRSASRRRRSSPIRARSLHPHAEAKAAARVLGLEGERSSTRCSRPSRRLRLRRAEGRPGNRGEAREAEAPGLRLLRRGAAHVPAEARSRRRCSATRASTTTGLAGLELEDNSALSGQARASRSSSATRSAARSTIDPVTPERAGQGGLPHDRPHDPGERRAGAARHRREVGREERDRDRARPADGRRARDGGGAVVRRERLPDRGGAASSATTPSPTSTSRARCSRS